jgi:hypothetical protein
MSLRMLTSERAVLFCCKRQAGARPMFGSRLVGIQYHVVTAGLQKATGGTFSGTRLSRPLFEYRV